MPEPLRPRKLGQLPALRGAFPAGEARAKSRPSQGRWPSASDGRRGSAALRVTQTFLQYHLDTTPQPCYSLTIKSVEEEKYRSISAQRARASGVSRDGDRARKNTSELQPEMQKVGCAAGRALQRQRFKGERVRKSDRMPLFRLR